MKPQFNCSAGLDNDGQMPNVYYFSNYQYNDTVIYIYTCNFLVSYL